MSKCLIIAVGGSGQTVVSHYLRYATMAGVPGEELPHIYILDADLKESVRENEAKPSLYGTIEKLHRRLVAGLSPARKPQLHLLYPYSSETALLTKQTFREYLIGDRPGMEASVKQNVLDGLFGKQEQGLTIAEGFFARPNVGATAIFDKLLAKDGDHTLQLLRGEVTAATGPRVVVIGSTFGGTGSGGAPVIAQKLREWAGDRNNIKIGIFLTLPWFSPGDLGKAINDSATTLGKWDTQVRNTAAGLRFYGSSQVFLNDLDVFIADYNGEKHPRWDDSNTGQPEYPHCFNLILAAQIQNYLTRPIPVDETPGQYSFYFLAPQQQRRSLSIEGDNSPLLRFNSPYPNQELNSNNALPYLRQDLADWALQTQTLRLCLNQIADYINRGFCLSDGNKRKRPDKFIDLAIALAKTCPHIPGALIKKGFWAKHAPEASSEIYGRLAGSLSDRASQLGDVIAWLQNSWEQSKKMPMLSPACLASDPTAIWDNYPALKRERNAEVAAIKLFDAAFAQVSNIVAEFEESIDAKKGQQEPFHAAAAIIEKILRGAILIPGGAGGNGQQDEKEPTNIPNDVTASALVPTQVTTSKLRNYYSLEVGLRQILDDGKDRDGRLISVFNESHPATLAGVTHYNVPSPWAAAHLKGWIQKAGYDRTTPKAEWTAAKQSLEAVLWGILSKQLRICSAPFSELSRLGQILSGALKAELYGYGTFEGLDRIVYVTANDGKTIAINHPLCGWFTAPELEAKWWKGLDIRLPTEWGQVAKNSLEASQLQAFLDYLRNSLLNISHADPTKEIAGWYLTLGALAAELLALIPTGTTPSSTITGQDRFFLLNLQSASVFAVPLTTLALSIVDIIAEFCVPEVAVVALGQGFRQADSPLRSIHLGKKGVNAQWLETFKDGQGRPTAVRYRLELDGHGRFEVERPAKLIDAFYTHTEIWPNFKMPEWKIYFLGSVSADPREISNYGFSVFDETGKRIGDLGRSFTHNHEIHGVPHALVLEFPKDDNREAGIFFFNLVDKGDTGGKVFNLAVDLGTSHSCVYATNTTDGGKRIPLDFSSPSEKLGKPVFDNPEVKEEFLVKSDYFLPCYCGSPQSTDTSVLPTELRLIGDPRRGDLNTGIKSFVIIPMMYKEESLLTHVRGSQTLGGFKWPGGLNGSEFERHEPDLTKEYLRQMLCIAAALLRDGGYRQINMFRATYPEAFSFPQRRDYRQAVADTITSSMDLTGITCLEPLDAEHILNLTSSQVPDGAKQESSGMVSESIAALLSASSSDYNFFADRGICIVLDMGGGTTDVAAYVSPGSGKGEVNESIPSITDSIRYAGHDLLRLLAYPKILNEIFSEGRWDEKTEEDKLFAALKILVRDPNHFQRLKQNFNSPNYLPDVKERMILFFEGLFEYTRILALAYKKDMQANGQKWVINIALFGNAWKLAELVYPTKETPYDGFKNNFNNYLVKALGADQEIHIRYEKVHDASIKEAITAGALKLNALKRQFATPTEHSSLAGLGVVCRRADGQDIAVPSDSFLMGFDRDGFDPRQPLTIQSLENLDKRFREMLRQRHENKDDAWITRQIGSVINDAIQEQWIVPGDREPMKFSPMRLFLENVWKETIRVVPLGYKPKGK
ncbi:MAG: hypothetical protein ACOYMG_04475 [Candidatus Methylumidiphilus sp.]